MKSALKPVSKSAKPDKSSANAKSANSKSANSKSANSKSANGKSGDVIVAKGQSIRLGHAHVYMNMKRMAPQSVQDEGVPSGPAVMCHVMLLNSVLERGANRVAEAHGLTMAQWMALGCIGHCGAEGIRHSELGTRLMLSKAPITGVVDRLERDGYVQRTADEHDRRVSRIVMTAQGEAAWKQVRQSLRQESAQVCAGLSSAEQKALLSLLTRLIENAAQTDPTLAIPMARGGASSGSASAGKHMTRQTT